MCDSVNINPAPDRTCKNRLRQNQVHLNTRFFLRQFFHFSSIKSLHHRIPYICNLHRFILSNTIEVVEDVDIIKALENKYVSLLLKRHVANNMTNEEFHWRNLSMCESVFLWTAKSGPAMSGGLCLLLYWRITRQSSIIKTVYRRDSCLYFWCFCFCWIWSVRYCSFVLSNSVTASICLWALDLWHWSITHLSVNLEMSFPGNQ